MKRISIRNEILAIIIHRDYLHFGLQLVAQPEFSQQLAYRNHPAGKIIEPRVHNIVHREVIMSFFKIISCTWANLHAPLQPVLLDTEPITRYLVTDGISRKRFYLQGGLNFNGDKQMFVVDAVKQALSQ